MLAGLILIAVLLFILFILYFIPSYSVMNKDMMHLSVVFQAGTSAFAFIMTLIMLGIVIAIVITCLGHDSDDYEKRAKGTAGFVSFFTLINVILHIVDISDAEIQGMKTLLVFMVIFNIITAVVGIVLLFKKPSYSYRSYKTSSHSSSSSSSKSVPSPSKPVKTSNLNLAVGDEVKLLSTEWGVRNEYEKGTIGTIVKLIPEGNFARVRIETPNGEEEIIKVSTFSLSKVSK